MNVYKYDELTHEYTGVETALLDPLETELQGKNVWLLPANATFVAPLVVKEGYTQVWDGKVWNYIEDNRGKQYWLPDDVYGTPAREMKELGALPDNAVFEAPAKPPETAEEIQKRLTDGVQNWMDAKVQERNYDNVHTCVGTYLYSPIEKFRLEAEAVRDWVSYVWAKCYEILAQVKNGEREIPTLEEVINELPILDWGVEE